MLAEKDISKTNDGNVRGNLQALLEEHGSGPDRDHIIATLNRRRIDAFVEHLQCGFLAFFDRCARAENEILAHLDVVFAQAAAIAIEPLLVPGGNARSGEVSDAPMAEFDQMLRC